MERFNINELLRYVTIGIFFIFLNYISIEKEFLKTQIDIIGKDGISVILFALSLTSGTLIYLLYRSIIYALILNPITTKCTNGKRKKINSELAGKTNSEIIIQTDIKRWKIDDDKIEKKLYEWASQVHFLYNISFCSLYVFIFHFIFSTIYSQIFFGLLIFSFLILICAVIHHIRYKNFEIEILNK